MDIGGYQIIEISTYNTLFFIAAYDTQSPESLLIELNSDKAEYIKQQFNYNYLSMANSLQINSKRLVLLNPKYLTQKKRLGTAPVQNDNEVISHGGVGSGPNIRSGEEAILSD